MKEVIDIEIKPIVDLFNKNGYVTFMSCQGGEGHSFERPIVGINFNKNNDDFFKFRQELCVFLDKYFSSYSINLKLHHGKKPMILDKKRCWWQFVYIEFDKVEIQKNYINKKEYK